jgi:hypothetical protein
MLQIAVSRETYPFSEALKIQNIKKSQLTAGSSNQSITSA